MRIGKKTNLHQLPTQHGRYDQRKNVHRQCRDLELCTRRPVGGQQVHAARPTRREAREVAVERVRIGDLKGRPAGSEAVSEESRDATRQR